MVDTTTLTTDLLRGAVGDGLASRLRALADALEGDADATAPLREQVRADLDALALLDRLA